MCAGQAFGVDINSKLGLAAATSDGGQYPFLEHILPACPHARLIVPLSEAHLARLCPVQCLWYQTFLPPANITHVSFFWLKTDRKGKKMNW